LDAGLHKPVSCGAVIVGIEHVAVACADAAPVLGLFERLGWTLCIPRTCPPKGVRSHQLDVGNARIEVHDPQRSDAALHAFLARRGPGLHHICFRVDDLQATVAQLTAAGLELVNPEPRVDGQGSTRLCTSSIWWWRVDGFRGAARGGRVRRHRNINRGWRSFDRLTFVPAVAVRPGELVFTSGLNAIK
jgi:methylmalonyl-CoA/ethylmalonyl-CoA epimerase